MKNSKFILLSLIPAAMLLASCGGAGNASKGNDLQNLNKVNQEQEVIQENGVIIPQIGEYSYLINMKSTFSDYEKEIIIKNIYRNVYTSQSITNASLMYNVSEEDAFFQQDVNFVYYSNDVAIGYGHMVQSMVNGDHTENLHADTVQMMARSDGYIYESFDAWGDASEHDRDVNKDDDLPVDLTLLTDTGSVLVKNSPKSIFGIDENNNVLGYNVETSLVNGDTTFRITETLILFDSDPLLGQPAKYIERISHYSLVDEDGDTLEKPLYLYEDILDYSYSYGVRDEYENKEDLLASVWQPIFNANDGMEFLVAAADATLNEEKTEYATLGEFTSYSQAFALLYEWEASRDGRTAELASLVGINFTKDKAYILPYGACFEVLSTEKDVDEDYPTLDVVYEGVMDLEISGDMPECLSIIEHEGVTTIFASEDISVTAVVEMSVKPTINSQGEVKLENVAVITIIQ